MAIHNALGRVCAVVVTYNIGERLLRLYNSAALQVDHIIVVDNGSTDDTPAILEALRQENLAQVEIVSNAANNLAKAQNIGIRMAQLAGYDWVLLLDHDSELAPDMLERMESAYVGIADKKHIGILAPYVRDKNTLHEPAYVKALGGIFFRRMRFGGRKLLDHLLCVIASGSLIPIKRFDNVGAMDEDFFIDYIDFDFCLRLIYHGYAIYAVRDAVLYHQLGERKTHNIAGVTLVTNNHSSLRRYYIYRNKLKIWRRYLFKVPAFVFFDVAAFAYDVLRIMLYEERRGEKFRFMLRGVVDGLRGVSGPMPG